MKIGIFLVGIIMITILTLISLAGLLFYFDPFTANKTIIVLFYLTLFFGLSGILTLGGFLLRRIAKKNKDSVDLLLNSFWQGSLLALTFVAILVLLAEI